MCAGCGYTCYCMKNRPINLAMRAIQYNDNPTSMHSSVPQSPCLTTKQQVPRVKHEPLDTTTYTCIYIRYKELCRYSHMVPVYRLCGRETQHNILN